MMTRRQLLCVLGGDGGGSNSLNSKPQLLDQMAAMEARLNEVREEASTRDASSSRTLASLSTQVDALLDYHSKGLFGKMFGKPRRPR